MARKRYSDEDCLKLLREIELQLAAGSDIATSCRSAGISDATYYTWRKRLGGMEVSEAKRLKSLEDVNRKLKKLLAEQMLDNSTLREMLGKMYGPPRIC